MKKRLLILLLLAVGVWAVIHFWPAELTVEVDPNWPHFNLADVNSVEFNTRHGMHSAERRGTEFVLLHNGIEYAALSDKIVEVIKYINQYTPSRKLADISPEKLAGFGLDNPDIRFTVFAKDQTWTIELGEQNPPKTGYYAKYSGSDAIVIVPMGFHEKLGRKYHHFVDKKVLKLDEQRVSEMRVTGPNIENFTIGVKKGVYSILEPESLRHLVLDQKEAKDYVHTVANLIADVFQEDMKDLPPLDSRFEFKLQGQETPLVFSVHKRETAQSEDAASTNSTEAKKDDDEKYIGQSTYLPVPFTVKEANQKRVYIDPKKLRSKAVVQLDVNGLGRMAFHGEAGDEKKSLTVIRSGRDWLEEKSSKPVPGLNVLLWRLSDLKYKAEPVQELGDTASLAFTWEFAGPQGESPLRVQFFRDSAFPEGQMWVHTDGDTDYFPVEDQLLKELETVL